MVLYFTGALVLLFDLLTKHIAVERLSRIPGSRVAVIPGFFDFYLQHNTGGAFSMGEKHPMVITALSVAAMILIFLWSRKISRRIVSAHIAFGLILGGATGNLIDRLRLHHVIDFLQVYYRDWYYPTFNLADSAICIGIGIFVILTVFTKKLDSAVDRASEQQPQPEAAAGSADPVDTSSG